VKVKLLKSLMGDDSNFYNAGAVIEVHDTRAEYFLAMGDVEKAKDTDKVTEPTIVEARESLETKAVKAAVEEAIEKGVAAKVVKK